MVAGQCNWWFNVEIVGSAINGLYVGLVRPGLARDRDYAVQEESRAWLMGTYEGSLFGNGKYDEDKAGGFRRGDILGVGLKIDGSVVFARNGVEWGPGWPAGSVARGSPLVPISGLLDPE